jgi:hypothetical protein
VQVERFSNPVDLLEAYEFWEIPVVLGEWNFWAAMERDDGGGLRWDSGWW